MALLRINRTPPPLQLQIFGLACLAVAAAGALKLTHRGHPEAAWPVGGLGAAVALVGLVAPRRLRWLYLALSYATYPIGLVLSYLLLAVLFYAVIVPIGLAFRACGYDPLNRRSSERPSYWIARKPMPDPKRYLQQS